MIYGSLWDSDKIQHRALFKKNIFEEVINLKTLLTFT